MNLIAGSGWVANLMDPDDCLAMSSVSYQDRSQYESFEVLEFGKLFWREGLRR